MAPKTSKKQKTTGSSSSRAAARPYDVQKFLTAETAERFEVLAKRKIWPEKEFVIHDNGDFRQIAAILHARKWDKLIAPTKEINCDWVREFYANALPEEGAEFTFETSVRNKRIRFDRDAINSYLGNPLTLPRDELCAFHKHLNRGRWNYEEIKGTIFSEGNNFELNPSGSPIRIHRDHLSTMAQVFLLLISHNVKPRSHMSTAPLETAYLLHYIIAGLQLDIARVISNEMKMIVLSGTKEGGKSTMALAFPGLIMGLCDKARVPVSQEVHMTISGVINDAYIRRFCIGRKKKEVAPTTPTEHVSQGQVPGGYQTRDQFLWDQNASIHRSLSILHGNDYKLQQQMGVPADSAMHIMTPEAFLACVGWPGDRPNFQGEASAAGGGADDDDETDNDESGDDGDDDDEDMED